MAGEPPPLAETPALTAVLRDYVRYGSRPSLASLPCCDGVLFRVVLAKLCLCSPAKLLWCPPSLTLIPPTNRMHGVRLYTETERQKVLQGDGGKRGVGGENGRGKGEAQSFCWGVIVSQSSLRRIATSACG